MSDPRDIAYDVETFCNVFTLIGQHVETGQRWVFELSPRVNHTMQLYWFLRQIEASGARMVGFNNVGFDWIVVRHFMSLVESGQGEVSPYALYLKAQEVFAAIEKFRLIDWQPRIPQIDLFKIHHFDNKNKSTSLKKLEFCMKSEVIIDLPFSPHEPLRDDQIDEVIRYNAHDVGETVRFYHYTWDKIAFRQKLEPRFGKSILNHNDTKIGKDYFIIGLERAMPGITKGPDGRGKNQTRRNSIPLGQVIFPYIRFETPDFNRVLNYLKTVNVTDTKKAKELDGVNVTSRGFQFDFGLGGIHGSLSATKVVEDDENEIIDVDVASFYPNLAIKNRVFPAHLTEKFCDIYSELYLERKGYPKKSEESEMLKLALNGVYGESNQEHGVFLDPAYTMTITVNGQLLICMLAEQAMKHPDIHIIQANTDGVTFRVHKAAKPYFQSVCKWWMEFSGLELEDANYSAMFIRDVNNYIAVSREGKVKRIGAYAYETQAENPATRELWWNKNWSGRVIAKAAEAFMLKGTPTHEFVGRHEDAFDFMMLGKAPGGSRLVCAWAGGVDTPLQSTTRYFIAKHGPRLVKIMPPLPKVVAKWAVEQPGVPVPERRMGIDVNWNVGICNHIRDWDWSNLERQYYIEEAEKLVIR